MKTKHNKQSMLLGIIPARYASTRFPGKPLVDIAGKPMIQRVYEQAKKALDNVVVATDDERILSCVHSFGGQAVMTRADHRCGTDRCLEAYITFCQQINHMPDKDDIVVNIQGDEPFIQPEQIHSLTACFDAPDTQIATLVKPYTMADSLDDLENPNTPKVVFSDADHRALYFSRSVIPYLRGVERSEWLKQTSTTFYRHIGMYAYKASVLKQITAMPAAPLEKAESLEQLRWLESGYTIRVGITETYSMGIDTPADLEQAIRFLGL